MAGSTGKVIFLNGTSSSGKSTIAKELQRVLPDPYLHVSIDAFFHQLPHPFFAANPERFVQELPRLVAGFNSSCAAVARTGLNIIVDTVLQEPSWVRPCAVAFEGLAVVFVAVRCSLATLESREKLRGDRRVGMARYQYDRVHSHGVYDVEVDTSVMPLEPCVAKIIEYVQSGQEPSAFKKLRAASDSREQTAGGGGVNPPPQP